MRTVFRGKTNASFCEEALCQPDLMSPQFNRNDEGTVPWISQEQLAHKSGSVTGGKGKPFY